LHLNIGDIVFQLFTYFIPIILIILLIIFIRSSKKRNQQLKRIEEKLDKVTEQQAKKVE
jgi:preprotein translocase subunit YajC